MRIQLLIVASLFFLSSRAQVAMPTAGIGFSQWAPFPSYHFSGDSNQFNQKWYLSRYAGLSTGFGFFNGGSSTYISAPVGVQLNHPLNNNLIAFAGISTAPTFLSFSHSFTDPAAGKYYPGSYLPNTYSFGMNSRVEMGLMYINDAKTFSISGSIGVERSSNPIYPIYPTNTVNRKNLR
jgi:hypothetical protein